MSLIRLVYASESRLVEANRQDETGRIVASAQRNNAANNVTGFLLITPGAFAQILEGDKHDVAETYGRIVLDPRHQAVRLLAEEAIGRRAFPAWSMGMAERDETTAVIFGLYGVTPDADLPLQGPGNLFDLASELARQSS